MWFATLAAVSANAGASHAIGHSLGGALGVPHGIASCVMLHAVMSWNSQSPAAKAGLDRVSRALELSEATIS